MSAAALRAPASAWRVARAEARAMLASRGLLLVTLVAVLMALGSSPPDSRFPWSPVAALIQPMLILPLLHWRGAGAARGLDRATPMGPVRYELIRFGVGAAGALAVLCTVALVHAWTALPDFNPVALETLPRGYAAALVIRGLACYAFGSIAVLRGRGQGLGPVLLGTVVVVTIVQTMGGLGQQTGSATDAHPPGQAGTIVSYTASLTLEAALTELAIALAALCASATLASRERGRPRLPWSSARTVATPLRPASPDEHARTHPRVPVPVLKVAARQFLAHAPRMMLWPAYALLLGLFAVAGSIHRGQPWLGGFSNAGGYVFFFAAFFWPLLVRTDGHGSDWEQALPSGVPAQRLLHWVVGLAWLQLWIVLVIADQVASEVSKGSGWDPEDVLALPLAVLAFYCLGTLPAMIKRSPVGWSIVSWMVIMRALLPRVDEAGRSGTLSPVRLFAPLLADEGGWSTAAVLVWIPVLAALAVAAIYLRVRWDLRPPSLPSARALRLRLSRT